MEIFQTFIAVIIIFAAAFYLLKISLQNKDDKKGCSGCSEGCCSCTESNCSETKTIKISSDINKIK